MSDEQGRTHDTDGESSDDVTAGPTITRDDARDLQTLLSATNDFYRGEMDRITTWRTRMDQTTNWAVVVVAAILTWVFSSEQNPHYVLLIGALAVTVFLFIEAQRYQEYDAWRERILLLQRNLYARGFSPQAPEDDAWRDELSGDLQAPSIDMSLLAAVGHRLQHVYFPLLTVVLAAWWARISVFDQDATFLEVASIGSIPGGVVVAGVAAWYLALAALAAWSYHHYVRREFDDSLDEYQQ